MAENSKSLEIAADRVESFDCTACGKAVSVEGMTPFEPFRCPHCDAIQSVPLRLGGFLLLSLLGKGGMGAVYRARDTTLNRYVAIKVMQSSLGDDPKFVEDFLREARAAAQFNHPHVAQIYSFGEEKGQACLVMELLEGGSLDKMIESGEPLDEVQVLDIAVHVAQALKAANKIGLRHGDIKPANILFSTSGQAKVVDFGLAWYAESHQQPGEIWGTPYYIAPEKVKSKVADHRADMYSFGATFFHALTGEPPFDGETAKELVVKRLNEPAPDVRTLRPDLSPKTAEVLARSLQRDPGRRHPTYTSMLADLQAARNEAERRREEAIAAAEIAAVRSRRKKRIQWSLASLLLIGGAAGAVWVKVQQAADAPAPRPIRHILVNGRLVPVYSDEEEQGLRERIAATRAGPTQPDDAPAVEQPLSPDQVSALEEAIRTGAEGDPIGATIALHRLQRAAPPGTATALVRLNLAISLIMEGEEQTAQNNLRALMQDLPAGQALHGIAAILLGEQALADAPLSDWPAAKRQLARFAAGIRELADGRLHDGIATLREFERTTSEEEHGWVAAWKMAVDPWAQQVREWDELQSRIPGWRPNTRRNRLRAFRRQAPWFLLDEVLQVLETATAPPRPRAQPAEPPEPEADTAQQEAADREALDALLAERRPLLAALDFEGAAALVDDALPRMKTAEGRQRQQHLAEQQQSLARLKDFVVDRLSRNPPAQPVSELRGTIAGADAEGLTIRIREGVTTERAWSEVGPGLYMRFADYYARREPGTPDQQADRFLALAAFSEALQASERAAAYAGLAVAADAGAAERASAWFPELEIGP